MKTYYVYDFQTNELICTMEASSVTEAEIKACVEYNKGSDDVYAFSESL